MRYCFAAALCITLLIPSTTWAGSWWWGATGIVYAAKESDVTLYWSHTNIDDSSKFSKWKFCWRRKTNTSKGKNPCEYNTKIVHDPRVTVHVDHNRVYKFQVDAWNKKKKKWQTKSPTISRPCFRTYLGDGTISSICNP